MEQKVKELIKNKLGISESNYSLDASIRDDWGCDSLDMVELIMECEKEFNLSIPDSVVERIKTPKDLIAYIKGHAK